METSPIAGKSRQPGHEPHVEGEKKQAPVTLIKQWKETEGQGRGDSLQGVPTLRKTLPKMPTKLLQRPMDQEHEESWRMHISNTGFVRVLENLESPGILLWHFPGLESPGKWLLVLESSGNLFNSSKKYEMYGRQ